MPLSVHGSGDAQREICSGFQSRAITGSSPRRTLRAVPPAPHPLGQPRRDAAVGAPASTLLLLRLRVQESSNAAPPSPLLPQEEVRGDPLRINLPSIWGPL